MAVPVTDPEFRFTGLEQAVLDLLAVPAAPEAPEGSPDSIRVFHAGRSFYTWTVVVWGIQHVAVFAGLVAMTSSVAFAVMPKARPWAQVILAALLIIAWVVFASTSIVTFLSRRLDYRLRWYIVTDRSLRIRSGIFNVHELTMTYGNIQEIRVSSGPLQHVLGLADVEVQAAGGGGDAKHGGGGHVGRFEGLSNANDIRDLLVERVRQYRDSGLGETASHPARSSEASEIAAARAMLDEARALRAALARSPARS